MTEITFNYKGRTMRVKVPEVKPARTGWELSYKTSKNGIGDHTDLTDEFKSLYTKWEPKLTSKNEAYAMESANKFKTICDGVAGRPLETKELITIIRHSQRKNPRMKINKYGHLFGRRSPAKNGLNDMWYK